MSFLTYKGRMRDTPNQKILGCAIDPQAWQIILRDSIRGAFRTQSIFYDDVPLQKYLTAKSH